jgi:hypothetical protein
MNHSWGQIILIAGSGEGEDTIWMQMLVLVIVATLLGIWGLIKTRANKFKVQEQDYGGGVGNPQGQVGQPIKLFRELKGKVGGIFLKRSQSGAVAEESRFGFGGRGIVGRGKPRSKPARERDLNSGMGLLEADFLVGIAEKTKSDDNNDVMMRKLSFNELLRREELDKVASNALKVYAINDGELYGRDIQCEAMRELAKRTELRPE